MLNPLSSILETSKWKGKAKGIIPDSLSGDIGTIPGDDLFTAIRRVGTMHGKVLVEAYVDGDTYSSGPVHLKLRITQMPALNDRVKWKRINISILVSYIIVEKVLCKFLHKTFFLC